MILDTNAISSLAQKDQTLIQHIDDAVRLAITFVSLGEYAYGIRESNVRSELELWLRKHLLTRAEILFPDLSTIEHYAEIRIELRNAGTPIPANDIWIAALVRQHDLPILSLDRHFDKVKGLLRVKW